MMSVVQDDEKSRHKLAQLRCVLSRCQIRRPNYSDKRIVNNILKEDFNINYKCDFEIIARFYVVRVCTILHMLASSTFDIDIFNRLLDRGADFTMKNRYGQTALHLLIKLWDRDVSMIDKDSVPFMNSILSAHVKFRNSVNPRDDNGISHLHVACIANHVEAIEWFLDNGASVNEAVNLQAPKYAGYTPLHFAAYYGQFEAARLLVSRGANINAEDASGMSVIDLLMACRLFKLHDTSNNHLYGTNENIRITRSKYFPGKEKIMELLLEKQCVSSVGLSSFQIASSLKDLTIAESMLNQSVDINYAVSMESPIYPGYTATHFATYNSIDLVKIMIKHGANFNVENAEELTPLDICVKRYSVQDIHDILSCIENWKNIYLSDGKTKLLDLVLSMRNVDQFRLFLQNNHQNLFVPNGSSLWSGCSILHLAVILSEKNAHYTNDESIVRECLERGLNVNAQDTRGRTPMHLAFRMRKYAIVNLFVRHLGELDEVINHVDVDNLSYLHIACGMHNEALVRKLLENSEPNIVYKGKRMPNNYRQLEPGWTPLHIAVTKTYGNFVRTLLTHGANVHATDAYGFTPIHWLLPKNFVNLEINPDKVDVLLESLMENPEDRVVDGLGLSYLHVACAYGHEQLAEKLLDRGSNINAIVNFENTHYHSERHFSNKPLTFLSDFSGFTPLHFATLNSKPAIIEILLRRGVDVFAKFSPNSCIFLEKINFARTFVPYLWNDVEMQKSMEKRLGLTKLHIACYMKNDEAIRSALLDDGIDVNAKIHADFLIFSGCTPLHMLLTVSQSENGFYDHRNDFAISSSINLLLDHEADVTIANTAGDTPIHIFCQCQEYFTDRDLCSSILLKAHRDFKVNPVNAEGWSHFHAACYFHEVEIVEKFLQCGCVDVDQPTDMLAKKNPGCSPLLLALSRFRILNAQQCIRAGIPLIPPPNDNEWAKITQTVDLLLKHRANVTTTDVYGDTPLHKEVVLCPNGIGILEKLVSYGADIKSENIRGETPLELWTFTNFADYMRIFQQNGHLVNCWNELTGEGYIAKVFLSHHRWIPESPEFKEWLQSSDVRELDEMGRTAIHNSVAHICHSNDPLPNYIYVIESFLKQGIDIDHQDIEGKTALHYAARTENRPGLRALLNFGAGVNVMDNDGKPAYFYPMQHIRHKRNDEFSVVETLHNHIQKLMFLGLEVSRCNQDLADDVQKLRNLKSELSQRCLNQIEMTKTMNVGVRSSTLFDFLTETPIMTIYPYLTVSELTIVDEFFKSIDYKKLDEISGIIRMQSRKMKARLELIDPAITSLRTLLGFSFAGLCEDIAMYLKNFDLKNLIASTAVKDEEQNAQ